jgi:CubicO group peptidase (beta-lactamase class C family)
MNRFNHFVVATIFCALATLVARAAEESGSKRVAPVSDAVKKFIEAKEVAGVVTLVANKEGIVHLDAAGFADIAEKKPMRADSIVWIASMTKPITGTAVMMLESEGKLSVDDPVEKYIPELAALKTADGQPAKITIKHLLTHTSGMGEISREEALECKTLADVIPLYAAKPLGFKPGEKWVYCQSSINTAGRIVEIVSGKSFSEFVDERLFGPLGMKDTTFYLREEQLPRLATSYRRTDKGELEATENFFLMGKPATSRDRFPAGNGGLFSTAADYAKFCRMILNGGELEGRRYLSRESLAKLTSVHTDDLKTGFTNGNGWGIGWCVIRNPQGPTEALGSGSFGHGGAYGTQAWIDPKNERIYILMVQRANFPNSDASELRRMFQNTASAALTKPAAP